MKRVLIILLSLLALVPARSQGRLASQLKPVTDSLAVLLQERTSVKGIIQIKSVLKRGNELDFYFTQNLGDFPWSESSVKWFRKALEDFLPKEYSSYKVGEIYSKNVNLEDLPVASLHKDGKVHTSRYAKKDPGRARFVAEEGSRRYGKGLTGRNIALWQSHGYYYEQKLHSWRWQRAKNFTTVEDMYTQSYVLPFLIPMLENAGAYVMTPRERDTQRMEIVCDNDKSFDAPREGTLRRKGSYYENGSWESCGAGFADKKEFYTGNDNPFTMGTARQTRSGRATWTADVPQRGSYAVYVSYKTIPGSTEAARYTVRHMGGLTSFTVNQKMGGGTWIYLGTFSFDGRAEVSVANAGKGILTADAVRFGGGMGKVARGDDDVPVEEWTISGMPSYVEGALYNMQWAGIDSTVTRSWADDYTQDYASRGAWVRHLSGGSALNPDEPGLGIPFDLSMAFHSDAGVTPNDSIVGTLAIYTLLCDGKKKYPDGSERMAAREYTSYIQEQVVGDIRALHNPEWSRRQIWDRSYSECRTTGVPGLILEILAHQNFADMKYGLDPSFRFTVSRAVYKGMLKFLSNYYGCPYAVQPLPVNSFSVTFDSPNTALLKWKPTADELEPTAKPTGYILYTRKGDGVFDRGVVLKTFKEGDYICATVPLHSGELCSFRIAAFNEGGISFPSETLCICSGSDKKVLIVNNFDRVSAPAWFDTPTYAGFDCRLDGGVPYMYDITYIGDMYQFRRQLPWTDDENAGFGSSFTDEAGTQTAGNTFDFPYVHARAMEGYSVCSASAAAFAADSTLRSGAFLADIICGKQVTTPGGIEERFTVFPAALQEAIGSFCRAGGNVLISGSNIGTDVWDMVYPVAYDSTFRASTKEFIKEYLGYTWLTGYASRTGVVKGMRGSAVDVRGLPAFSYCNTRRPDIYCVETPDGLNPGRTGAKTFLRYGDTNVSAAVCCDFGAWKSVCLGFPLETVTDEGALKELMNRILNYYQ